MLRCIIAEDEPLAQKIIEKYITQTPQLQLVGVCSNALQAFELLHRENIDVIFLDIKMPGINGVDFLRSLKNPPAIIFTTAYAEYAAQSYELEAVDYLMKPVTYERFKKSIHKLFKKNVTAPEVVKPGYIFIKVDGKLVKIFYDDILYIEAMKDYLKLVTRQKTHITHMTVKTMQELLPAEKFLRVHRSYIVAIGHITSAGNTQLQLSEKVIPVSESYRKQLFERIAR